MKRRKIGKERTRRDSYFLLMVPVDRSASFSAVSSVGSIQTLIKEEEIGRESESESEGKREGFRFRLQLRRLIVD